MDIKEYITSGIIEQYVFNSVSPQEKQEVECMSQIYPEIKEELTSLQSSIEKLALASAVSTPTHIKMKVMDRIQSEKQDPLLKKVETSSNKLVPLNVSNKSNRTFKYIAAACFISFAALGIYTSKLNNSTSDLQQKLVTQKSINNELSSKANLTAEQIAFLTHSKTNKIVMNGIESHPEMLATVFWNTLTEKVMIEIENLPEVTSDKQYQLWAIIDGTPTDMGVFDVNGTNSNLLPMKNAINAVAFAVTLEPKGGSVAPTFNQMYLIGNV